MLRITSRLLVLVLMVAAFGCSSDQSTAPVDDESPPSEVERFQESFAAIDAAAFAALHADDPVEGLQGLVPVCEDDPLVESAWVSGSALWVQYRGGGRVCWFVPTPMVPPPGVDQVESVADPSSPVFRALVGNRNACIVNQVYEDENRYYCITLQARQRSRLEAAGYTVTEVNSSAADLDFFAEDLDQFGVVFDISHGEFDGSRNWLLTGQEGSDLALYTAHFDDWRNDRISLANYVELREGEDVELRLYMVSDLFFLDRYDEGDLPHSLIYLVACESFEGSTQLPQALHSRGAAATVGWDDRNGIGHTTGESLFKSLLGGEDLASALDDLEPDESTDPNTGAELRFHPPTGGSVRLVEAPPDPIPVIANDFESWPTGSVPPVTGGHDPVEYFTRPVAFAVTAEGTLGFSSKYLRFHVAEGGFVYAKWSFEPQATGVLRVESKISVQTLGAAILLHTSIGNHTSNSAIQTRADGTLWAASGERSPKVGSYQPGIPFAVRMDHDLSAGTYTVTIDNELDGFDDDLPSDPVVRVNDHIEFDGITGLTEGILLAGGVTTLTVGYDDLRVVRLP